MLVHHSIKPLQPISKLVLHLIRSLTIGILFIVIALGIGMMGYHYYEGMDWADAFINAAMILSGMGPVIPLASTGGKIFAGCYALFSGLAFILIMGIIFSPIVLRFFHKFHIEINKL